MRGVAWHLPRSVVMWCFFRVFGYATSGKYERGTNVSTITAIDVIGRWNDGSNR
jgi:hypothetical protein